MNTVISVVNLESSHADDRLRGRLHASARATGRRLKGLSTVAKTKQTMVAPRTRRAPASELLKQYQQARQFTEKICEPLAIEDYVIQSMPDVSPTRWHLAHTSWFFETFLLSQIDPDYRSLHPKYNFLFNSYYNAIGPRHCRASRGVISRPTVAETYTYRHYVDEHMTKLLESADEALMRRIAPIVTLGINHEQQHQELMITDIKHVLSCNPLAPVYRARAIEPAPHIPPLEWLSYPEGIREIGYAGDGFSFDNEGTRHKEYLQPFQLASRLVTNGEYLDFIEDGGYRSPLLWLSEGWATVQANDWVAPLYWEEQDGIWFEMTLSGMREVDRSEPVCHISYFEADAFAHWSHARLPTEAEWEVVAQDLPLAGNFVEQEIFHPQPLRGPVTPGQPAQMFGDVWEWTQSAYLPYPGFKIAPGAVGEYNGKFMCNQFVLRGGSCATPESHIRATYRNFFPPNAQWQFMGMRLAREV